MTNNVLPMPPAIHPRLSELDPQQAAFVKDRRYSSNVTVKTVEWYIQAFVAFKGCSEPQHFKQRIVEMRDRNVKPVSINTWIRCLNAYFHWMDVGGADRQDEGKCSPACKHFKLRKQKGETRVLPTFTREHQKLILSPRKEWERTATGQRAFLLKCGLSAGIGMERAQVLAALLLDTGMRLTEALELRRSCVDMENLLVKVLGKGRKERIVPISLEGRRWLWKWITRHTIAENGYLFGVATGNHLSKRCAERDVRNLCLAAGVEGVRCSPHTFRHTFAVSYIRAGGNLEFLRRILGHTSIAITQQYLRDLGAGDVQAVHDQMSPLSMLG